MAEQAMADQPHKADALILFGATGDLARRRLYPALYAMEAENDLGDTRIVGVARSEDDDESLRRMAREAIEAAGVEIDESLFADLAKRISLVKGDYTNEETFEELADRLAKCECSVAYLAIPPDLFDDVIEGLGSVGLSRQGRVVVEKPFGRDLESADELNRIIHRHYPESHVYRIDHFLGKEALQNLMVFRFSNTLLEPIWNRHYIRGVQITMAEDFGVMGRGAFYDTVGALRDVVQNHLLVLLALLAMEPPVSDESDALRDERVKVLKATRAMDPSDVVYGRYEGYLDEPGVDSDSTTETYFAARLEIDSWRWAGVPWVIRAGKGLSRTVTEAVVEFWEPPSLLFTEGREAAAPNRLVFQSKPTDRITLEMQAKRPGPEIVSEPVSFSMEYDDNRGEVQDAYHRLLSDALEGDPALFARVDGVMEGWRVVEPVLEPAESPLPYAPGARGPAEADRLVDGWGWLTDLDVKD